MSKEIEVSPDQPIVTPVEADRVAEMIRAFDYFKSKVLTERDFCEIQNKPYVKKSGWSKYALACNVSTEVKDERTEERNGSRIYHFAHKVAYGPVECPRLRQGPYVMFRVVPALLLGFAG